MGICCEIKPDLATLVPEKREEITTEGGLDAITHATRLKEVIHQLKSEGVPDVALFLDPDLDQID